MLEWPVRDRAGGSDLDRLESVLAAYARFSRHAGGSEGGIQLHRAEHMGRARQRLHGFIADLIAAGDEVRDDVPADELASYVLGAMSAAGQMESEASVRRLVTVTLAGLRPPP